MPLATYFFSGLLFAVGLVLGGKTQPQNIIGFLDVFGDWKPSLAFVMFGAVLVHSIAYRLILRRAKPLLAPRPRTCPGSRRSVDSRRGRLRGSHDRGPMALRQIRQLGSGKSDANHRDASRRGSRASHLNNQGERVRSGSS